MDSYEMHNSFISRIYPFKYTGSLEQDEVVKDGIISYMASLFLRQYSIQSSCSLDQPNIPKSQLNPDYGLMNGFKEKLISSKIGG